jgi:hypothetical protein
VLDRIFPTDAPLKSKCVLAFLALGGVPVVAGLVATALSCNGAQDGIPGGPMPVGTYITFGKFRVMHLGDITKNQEFELMCPINGRRRAGARLREAAQRKSSSISERGVGPRGQLDPMGGPLGDGGGSVFGGVPLPTMITRECRARHFEMEMTT